MPVLHRWLPPGVRLALPPALLALCLVLANPSRPVPFYVLLPAAALSVALNLLLVVECDALGRIPTLPWTALGLTCATVLVRGFSGIIADEHGSRAAARIYWVYLLVAVPASCAVWIRQDYGLTNAERRQPLFSLPSQGERSGIRVFLSRLADVLLSTASYKVRFKPGRPGARPTRQTLRAR